ncbi:hypothetical protein C2S51_024051 [Perilla frutescens var. frutescens]|nr:hypothetical protein C2S51_024051 [Perilla frutescens var. frutescens]
MEKLIHSLNFYGILVKSLTIILLWKKIFTQITIATIFPLSLLSLCHAQISELLFLNEGGSFKNSNISIWDHTLWFWLFKIVHVVFFLVLSLVSTSAVVYAVARAYTTREVCSFGEVMSVVPRVWKRLMATFAWSLVIVVVYNVAAFSLLFPWLGPGSMDGVFTARITISGPVLLVYMIGFVYTSMVWHLGSVVSVLEEDCCGVEAMIKSKALVRGNMLYHCELMMVASGHHKVCLGDYAPLRSNEVQQLDQC